MEEWFAKGEYDGWETGEGGVAGQRGMETTCEG
jgi:hypothetical protein